jgi:hypothetical protein
MQIKWLSFAFIYFSESGLFNGLRPIQIRKIDSRLRLCAECLKPVPLSRPHAVCLGAGSLPANGKIYSTDFRFPQTIALFFVPAPLIPARRAKLERTDVQMASAQRPWEKLERSGRALQRKDVQSMARTGREGPRPLLRDRRIVRRARLQWPCGTCCEIVARRAVPRPAARRLREQWVEGEVDLRRPASGFDIDQRSKLRSALTHAASITLA